MVDWDKAVCEFKNIMTQEDFMQIVKLIETGFKGKFMTLQLLAENNGKLFAGELAKLLCVSTARVAVTIKTLEQKGYVKRCQFENDARKVEISITDSGSQILSEYIKQADDFLRAKLQNLNEEELKTLIVLSKKLFS